MDPMVVIIRLELQDPGMSEGGMEKGERGKEPYRTAESGECCKSMYWYSRLRGPRGVMPTRAHTQLGMQYASLVVPMASDVRESRAARHILTGLASGSFVIIFENLIKYDRTEFVSMRACSYVLFIALAVAGATASDSDSYRVTFDVVLKPKVRECERQERQRETE